MKTGRQVFKSFTTINSYACNGCRQPLTESRVHCFDCGVDLCDTCADAVHHGRNVGRHTSSHVHASYLRPTLLTGTEFAEEREKLRASLSTSSGYFQQLVFPFLNTLDESAMSSAITEGDVVFASIAESTTGYLSALAKSLQFMLSRQRRGRFESYFTRRSLAGSDVPRHILAFSQGVFGCNHWKGLPLQKTVFECAIYPMLLWDLRPRTIIEIGSGTGASAIWMADHMSVFGLHAHVYSLDLQKSPLTHECVTFFEGDCNKIAETFSDEFLTSLPHPWLVIEDAHENVLGVIRHIGKHLLLEDYLIVEDSEPHKEDAIGKFIVENPGMYSVDTWYTDFFGYNAVCAVDSILKRIK
jgi:cephalosporin hydroxylase